MPRCARVAAIARQAILNVVVLVPLLAAPQLIRAADTPLDLPARYPHLHTTFVVNEDGTAVESREWSMTVLKETALAAAKQASVSYSTSAQKAEIVAAYTRKADGRRIDAPENNYQTEVQAGKGSDAPVFSDRSTLTVVFPDVAVGDTVVFSYRLVQTEPLFPRHFSVAATMPRHSALDDVRVRFDYPASLWVQHEARGMTESEASEGNGRKVVEWRYANPKPAKSERRDFSVIDPDKEAGYSFSTFRTYEEIAAAYGARAVPKAAVTERVRELAAQTVKDKTAPRDQARALYEWVATNITYGGNCIGIGAVVPRDVAFILDNKMGDCKDHATLLQALLAARGIESTQALVNAGSVYRLPRIPVVAMVNHVINYIPALDLYMDSTSDSTPFGMLPFENQDKPVLLVQGYRDGTRTPVPPAGADRQRLKSVLKIAQDGSVSGTVEVSQKGAGAAQSRAWARSMTREWEEDFVKNAFRAQGAIGSGKLEKDDPRELTDVYRYQITFTREKFVKPTGAGAFYVVPVAGGGGPILGVVRPLVETEPEADVVCSGGQLDEEYVIELPRNMKVLSIPEDLKVTNAFASYSATYKLKGNMLTARRTLDDRTKGNVCSPQVMAEQKKLAERVLDNLQAQVLYK